MRIQQLFLRIIPLLLGMLSCQLGWASDSLFTYKGDAYFSPENPTYPTHIVPYTNSNNFRLYTGLSDHTFDLTSKNDIKGEYIQRYNPNSAQYVGISMTYRWATIFLEVDVPGTKKYKNDSTKGFQSQGFEINTFNRSNGFEAYIRYFKGFINPGSRKKDKYRGDISLITLGGNYYHIFNSKKFSYKAANFCSERQLGSAGSFILVGQLFYNNMLGKNPFFPDSINNTKFLGDEVGLRKIVTTTFAIRPGYSYNITSKNGIWFINPSIYAGLGVEYHRLYGNQGRNAGLNSQANGMFKLTTGYNGLKFFAYITGYLEVNTTTFINTILVHQYQPISFNLGYRFRNKKFKNRYLQYLDLD